MLLFIHSCSFHSLRDRSTHTFSVLGILISFNVKFFIISSAFGKDLVMTPTGRYAFSTHLDTILENNLLSSYW